MFCLRFILNISLFQASAENGAACIKMWNITDIESPVAVQTIPLPDVPFSMAIGGGMENKHALLAVSTKDGFMRVYDCASSSGKQIFEAAGHKGSKASRVFWISDSAIGTVGFS